MHYCSVTPDPSIWDRQLGAFSLSVYQFFVSLSPVFDQCDTRTRIILDCRYTGVRFAMNNSGLGLFGQMYEVRKLCTGVWGIVTSAASTSY